MAFCGHAILEPDRPLVVQDATQDPRFADNPLVTGDPNIRFYAGVPLVNTEGHALGTLCVIDQAPRALPPEQVETLASLARTVTTTLELRRAMRRVEHLALTDALTGLQNRPAFLSSLRKIIARQRRARAPFSLLYLDLDGLKRVNDVQGHAAGDAALIGVGRVLRTHIRTEDVAARLGGDEFAALLEGGDGAEAALVAERLRRVIKKTMDDGSFPVTASIGAVCFMTPPEDESEALAMADELMYAAKRGGRNRVLCLDHVDAALAAQDRAGFTSAA